MVRLVLKTFMLGTLAGGVAVWLYGDRIRAYLDGHLEAVRGGLLDVLDAVTDTVDTFRTRLEGGLAEGPGELGALAGAERAERRGTLGGTGIE